MYNQFHTERPSINVITFILVVEVRLHEYKQDQTHE